MRPPISEAQVDRAIASAFALMESEQTATPHTIIHELIGLDRYRLYMGCPDPERLAAYAEENLPFEEALRMAVHENACPLCRAEITDLRGFVRQSPAHLFAEMPVWSTPFQQRIGLQDQLSAALEEGESRCVALTAPPGMGKTRLLLETAVEQSFHYPDGVWYVPCGQVQDERQLLNEIATAANLPFERRAAPSEQLRRTLAAKNALMVLDDVQTTGPALRFVEEIMAGGSELRVLAGSRSSIPLNASRSLSLTPLDMPRRSEAHDNPLDSAAVRFFYASAQTFEQTSLPTDHATLEAIQSICSRAEGNPLGIELAAARGQQMSPQEIAERLQRFEPPSGTSALESLLAWTIHLLTPREQRLLRNLSVFTGSFAPGQAESVCEEAQTTLLLENLTRHALVQPIQTSAQTRYRLLDPVRGFVQAHSLTELAETRRRHALYFLGFARRHAEKLDVQEQVEAMQALTTDLPNLRSAVRWAQDEDERFVLGSFGLALNRYFFLSGDWQEGVEGLRRALTTFERSAERAKFDRARLSLAGSLTNKGEFDEAETLYNSVAAEAISRNETELLAEARHGLGNIAQRRRRYPEATLWFSEALNGFERTGNVWLAVICRLNLGWVKSRQGEFKEAEALLKACVPALRTRGDRYPLGDALSSLGNIARLQGRWEEARRYFEECLTARQEVGYVSGIAAMINNIGETWQASGDFVRAEYCYTEAARRYEQLGNKRDLASVIANQGSLALERSEKVRARDRFEEALRLVQETGDTHTAARLRRDLGRLAESEGRQREAAAHYRESLLQLDRLGAKSDVVLTLFHYGRLAASQNATRNAGLLLTMAAQMGTQLQLPESEAIQSALVALEKRLGKEMLRQLTLQASTATIEEILAFIANE